MNERTQRFSLFGKAGNLECALDIPEAIPRGIVLIAHPHPLYGGTMDHKVVQVLCRTFLSLQYAVARMNFREAGDSEGKHDFGEGEADDMQLLLEHMREKYPDIPMVLAGFSFGTYVQAHLQQRLIAVEGPADRLVLLGSAAGKWDMPAIPKDTVLIHGELDETIPLQDALEWARLHDIPMHVIPGGDHYFHRKLHHIQRLITSIFKL